MIDVRALIGDIPTTTIMVTSRTSPTINAFGEPESTSSGATVTAVVHPADRRAIERLPEADRARELIAIYVLSEDAFDAVRTTPPPRITYAGRVYEVVDVRDYVELGGVLMATAALMDEVSSP